MSHTLRFISLFSTLALVIACASSQTKEPVTVEEEAHYQPIHLTANKSIASDVKHANYNDTATATDKKAETPLVNNNKESTPKIKKTIPIVRERPQNIAPSVNYQIANILFANGSSAIDSSYRGQIAKIARLAKQHNAQIRVYGFSSSRTRNTDAITHKMINFKTSLRRAQSVAAALRRAGINKQNITIEALSDSRPLFSEAMPEGERLNRRAEVYIAY